MILPLSCYAMVLLSLFLMQATFIGGQEDISLHFINILPFPDSQFNAGWDRGYELLPAAELAMDHINSAPNILPGYRLHIVTVPSEPCGISLITDGLVNSFAKVYERGTPLNVVGMGGLFCSTVTNALTGIFSSPNVKYLQLAGSTTPAHRKSTEYPWLVHFISSSNIFNSALYAMMRTYSWKKIGIIYSTTDIFFVLDALDFVEHANELGFEVVGLIPLSVHQDKSEIFHSIQKFEARIVYITASNSRAAVVMCEAYKNKAFYPGYVFIFHDPQSVAGIAARADDTDCTAAELKEVMEGVFIINYNLAAKDDSMLFSNMSYREYYREYTTRVQHVESLLGITLDRDNMYANTMYDQVWALALALNASLGTLAAHGIDLGNIKLLDTSFIAETLRNEIGGVSFQGASGYISFNAENEHDTSVHIIQIVGGREELVAEYQGERNVTECPDFSIDLNATLCELRDVNPPPDFFETIVLLLPVWAFIVAITTIGLLTVQTTASFILLYAVFRNRPEVKATSASLSVVMNVGCYMVYLAALMRTVNQSFEISNSVIFSTMCSFETWLESMCTAVLFSALLMRLLRVRQIFKAYGRVSRFWDDKYLILCLIFICFGMAVILSLWTGLDPYRKVTIVTYERASTPPHFKSSSICHCDYHGVWIALTSIYNAVLMLLIIIMAVQTRKIKLSNFKDTKKINIFITATCTTLVLLFPLFFIVGIELDEVVWAFFISLAMILCTALYCQVFLFLPLVVKVLRNVCAEQSTLKSLSSTEILQKRERQYSKI